MEPILALAVLALFAAGSSAEIVQTEGGPVDGSTFTVMGADGINVEINSFQGIPYAKPPVGNLRFQYPKAPAPWTDTMDVTKPGAACIQGLRPMPGVNYNDTVFSEDCLFVNVFAPKNPPKPLPVIVYIHGGAFVQGWSSLFPTQFLATKGVVVVTFNYRLGIFGFLSTSDGTVKGNMGLLDQFMALLWVKNNIAAFGGNAEDVTLMGQDAGGASVHLHSLSPVSRGLFQRYVILSGLGPWPVNGPEIQPHKFIFQSAKKLNCPLESIALMVDCLQNKSADELSWAQNIKVDSGFFTFGMTYAPIIDGPGRFLPDDPKWLEDAIPERDSLPFIAGITENEGVYISEMLFPKEMRTGQHDFKDIIKKGLVDDVRGDLNDAKYDALVNALAWKYRPFKNSPRDNERAFSELLTDYMFGFEWKSVLERKTEKAKGYSFVYNYKPSYAGSNWMGASHMSDLPFLFGAPFFAGNPTLAQYGAEYPPFDRPFNDDDREFSNFFMNLFVDFAKTGNPTPNDNALTWPAFSEKNGSAVLFIANETEVKYNYREKNYQYFTKFLPSIVDAAEPVCPQPREVVRYIVKFKPRYNSKKAKRSRRVKKILKSISLKKLLKIYRKISKSRRQNRRG